MSTPATFTTLYAQTLTFPPPLLHPPKPHTPTLTPLISSLLLHPALESALHILNYDLPSAHFLLRKMQSSPASAGMLLHGVLHRIEGDYDNARAWYADVSDTDIVESVWGSRGAGAEGGKAWMFIRDVQSLDGRVRAGEKSGEVERMQTRLEKESQREIRGIVEYLLGTVGAGEWTDATGTYAQSSEKIRKAGEEQTTGAGGMRKF